MMMNWFDNRVRVSIVAGVSPLLTSVGSSNPRSSLYPWRLWSPRPSWRPPWSPARSICWSSPQSAGDSAATTGTAAEERVQTNAGGSAECTGFASDGAVSTARTIRSPGERRPRSQHSQEDSGSSDRPTGFDGNTPSTSRSLAPTPDYRTGKSSEADFHRHHQQLQDQQPQLEEQVTKRVVNEFTQQQEDIGPALSNDKYLNLTQIPCRQGDILPQSLSQEDQGTMERIERLRQSLFLRSDVMLTGNVLSALCFILGMIMLTVHSFVEERAGETLLSFCVMVLASLCMFLRNAPAGVFCVFGVFCAFYALVSSFLGITEYSKYLKN